MAKVLISHSYFLRLDPKQWLTRQPYAPLGSLYAAAVLRQNGHEVIFFDTMFCNSPDEIEEIIVSAQPDFLILYDDGFNYLTKMCLTNMREAAYRMIRIGKKLNCKVAVSSSDSTDHFDSYLNNGADAIIIGEGETTIVELLNTWEKDDLNLNSIDGIAYRSKDGIVKTRTRAVLRDLDSLPLPAWDLIDLSHYKKMWQDSKGYFSMNIATTRGCPFKCNWCAKPIYGNRYNARSPENVVNELIFLKELHNFDHIWFCDDIFGLKPGWVKEFAQLVREWGLDFSFKIQARADLLLQEDYVKDLALAGCSNVWMGAESGSQKILDAMDKGTTVRQIFEATALLKKHGINPSFFIQFGYPGESKEDIQETIRMITKLLPFEIGISVSYPLPGTVFYERVKSQLKEKSNWTDSDELALMFRNTYTPGYYKRLHRYVHYVYRRQLAIEQIKRMFGNPFSSTYERIKRALSIVYYAPAAFIDRLRLKKLETLTNE